MLLFDQNLSPHLVERLRDAFQGSQHVYLQGLAEASDEHVWEYARQADLAIVTKDADFEERSLLYGAPPKVILIQIGNCTTGEVETLLRRHEESIKAFVKGASDEAAASVLTLL